MVKSSRHETSVNVRCQHAKHKNSQPILGDRKWDRLRATDHGNQDIVSPIEKCTLAALYRERAGPLAGAFGRWEANALDMKTSAGSLKRALNFRTCSKVRLRCPVMNIETALSEPN